MIKEKSCGAIIFRKSGGSYEVVLINHVNGGHWAFPKGHVENGETEEQTALREIMEETGLSVTLDPGFRRTVTFSPTHGVVKDVIYFIAFTEEDDVRRQIDEVNEIRFVRADEAAEVITFDNDRAVFAAALGYLKDFDQLAK